jgi:hypothetical protein
MRKLAKREFLFLPLHLTHATWERDFHTQSQIITLLILIANMRMQNQRWLSNGQTISPAADSSTWFVRMCSSRCQGKIRCGLRKCHSNASLPSRTYPTGYSLNYNEYTYFSAKKQIFRRSLVCRRGEKIALDNYCQIWLFCFSSHHIWQMNFILPFLDLQCFPTECWQLLADHLYVIQLIANEFVATFFS